MAAVAASQKLPQHDVTWERAYSDLGARSVDWGPGSVGVRLRDSCSVIAAIFALLQFFGLLAGGLFFELAAGAHWLFLLQYMHACL